MGIIVDSLGRSFLRILLKFQCHGQIVDQWIAKSNRRGNVIFPAPTYFMVPKLPTIQMNSLGCQWAELGPEESVNPLPIELQT